jgi:hypothetical protein
MAVLLGGISKAISAPKGLTPLQSAMVVPLTEIITHTSWDGSEEFARPSLNELAVLLRTRDICFRTRVVQVAEVLALADQPLCRRQAQGLRTLAYIAGVDEGMLSVTEQIASGNLLAAKTDYEHKALTAYWDPIENSMPLHTAMLVQNPWDSVYDKELAALWEDLGKCNEGSLGKAVHSFYKARGFQFPGKKGSVSPHLAQHDFVHVLFDYGTTVEAELEVFASIAFNHPDPRAFSYLVGVMGVFQSSYFQCINGSFESNPGHMYQYGMPIRFVEAIARGMASRPHDLLNVDWFNVAEYQVADIRLAYEIPPKTELAHRLGSYGPFEPGGMSEAQFRRGTIQAVVEGREYNGFGGSPGDTLVIHPPRLALPYPEKLIA